MVAGLLELYPFKRLYIADLDAIQQRGHHREIIASIQSQFPQLEIWLDAGIAHIDELRLWQGLTLGWVMGSESLSNIDAYQQLKATCGQGSILSLDFAMTGYQGPDELLQDYRYWPDTVIAMTLSQVGSEMGPDLSTLTGILQRSGDRKVYAAGGVRNMADIQRLQSMGVHGVLVASALHNGQISRREIGAGQ